MLKKIKLLEKLQNDSDYVEADFEAEYTNEQNEAIIYVNANSVSDIVSSYSSGEDLTITNELSDYLESKVDNLSVKYPINIKINNSKEFTKKDKDNAKLAIRNAFSQKVSNINRDLRKNKIENIILTILTLITLVGYIACKLITNIVIGEIISEIILIIAWVFAWRLVENLAFDRRIKKKNAIKFYRLLNARIEFFN